MNRTMIRSVRADFRTEGNRVADAVKNSKLETLRKRKAQLEAKIAEEQAKQKKLSRKDDTRLKVIVGAAMIANAELHPETRVGVVEVLRKAVTAPRDREFLTSKGWL